MQQSYFETFIGEGGRYLYLYSTLKGPNFGCCTNCQDLSRPVVFPDPSLQFPESACCTQVTYAKESKQAHNFDNIVASILH